MYSSRKLWKLEVWTGEIEAIDVLLYWFSQNYFVSSAVTTLRPILHTVRPPHWLCDNVAAGKNQVNRSICCGVGIVIDIQKSEQTEAQRDQAR